MRLSEVCLLDCRTKKTPGNNRAIMDTRIIEHLVSTPTWSARAASVWIASLSTALILTACGGGAGQVSPDVSGGNVDNNGAVAPVAASSASDASATTPDQAASDATTASDATPASDASATPAPGFQVGTTTVDPALPPGPTLPTPTQICQTLPATLTAQAYDLLPESADAANTAPDTTRIQAALTACTNAASTGLSTNKVVRLTSGANGANAFLSGPLNLPSGVTLWIDRRVTLFASRDPRQFDKTQGTASCGLITASDNGCNALITAAKTSNSAVVGDGTIDGRGGSQLVSSVRDDPNLLTRADGSAMSWWDIGYEANVVQNKSQNNPRLIHQQRQQLHAVSRDVAERAEVSCRAERRAGLHCVGRQDLHTDGRLRGDEQLQRRAVQHRQCKEHRRHRPREFRAGHEQSGRQYDFLRDRGWPAAKESIAG
ncbi:hypothetical protein PPGU19_018630 [Paraburkholderia sp. PGU19]|nr:hypothetical protein PPGU19_018630 [Paraburkholderia sp. PGU19]